VGFQTPLNGLKERHRRPENQAEEEGQKNTNQTGKIAGETAPIFAVGAPPIGGRGNNQKRAPLRRPAVNFFV